MPMKPSTARMLEDKLPTMQEPFPIFTLSFSFYVSIQRCQVPQKIVGANHGAINPQIKVTVVVALAAMKRL